jgi:tape measure domain-containing protein
VAEIRFTVGTDTDKAITDLQEYFDALSRGSAKVADVLEKNLAKKMTQEFQIKMKGGKLVKEEIGSLGKQADRFAAAQSVLNGELGSTASYLRKQLEALKAVRDTTKKYQDNTKKLNKDWVKVNEAIDKVAKNLKDINKTELGFGGEGLVARLTKANLLANALQAAFNRLASGISNAVQTGMEFEVLNLSLEAFTGSAEAAEGAMQSFQQTAIKTPLNLEQVAKGGQVLLAFGLSAGEAAESVDKLAIIAGATGSDLNNLSRNLGQIQSQGRAFTRDLNQFAVAGIPIFQELAKVMGVSVEEVRELATQGSVGFAEVSQAITNMTKEGSAFNDIGKRMQETWLGQIEKLASDFQLLAGEVAKVSKDIDNAFGAPVQNTLKALGGALKFVTNNLDGIVNVLRVLGPMIVAVVSSIALINIPNIIAGLVGLWGQIMAINAALAKTAVGLTTINALAGPAGWATLAVAVGAGATAFAAMGDEMNDMSLTTEQVNEQLRILNGELEPTQMTSFGKSITAQTELIERYGEELEELIAIIDQKKSLGLNFSKEEERRLELITLLNGAYDQHRKIITDLIQQQGGEAAKAQQRLLEQQQLIGGLNDELQEQKRLRDELKKTYEDEKKKLSDLKQIASDYYREQIAGINDLISKQKQKIQDERTAYNNAMAAVRKKYEDEKRQLDEVYGKILRNIGAEISALQNRTPSEQKLYDLEKKSLKAQIESGKLNDKEELQAKARLERMGRQERIEKLQERQQQVRIEQQEKENKLADERRIKEEELAQTRDENIERLTTVLEKLEGKLGGLEQDQEDFNNKVKDSEQPLRRELTNLGLVKSAVFEQIGVIEQAQGSYQVATDKVGFLENAIISATEKAKGLQIELQDAINLQLQLRKQEADRKSEESKTLSKPNDAIQVITGLEPMSSPSIPSDPKNPDDWLANLINSVYGGRFAGGPVSGGSAYTVNELGKEAFLSAAGKLSMINAPSFGKWRAPSSGTVIPAHLTKKLDIPTGGVDLNSNAGQASRKVGPSLMMSLLAGLQGSENIQNNVTVQSMNPTKTASDMLVQLTKLRRRRMY